jgi:hypothetical protein
MNGASDTRKIKETEKEDFHRTEEMTKMASLMMKCTYIITLSLANSWLTLAFQPTQNLAPARIHASPSLLHRFAAQTDAMPKELDAKQVRSRTAFRCWMFFVLKGARYSLLF